MLYFLFNDNETSLIFCNSFWFSILIQVIEQSTTQLKIDLDKFLNDIINNHDLNSNITLLINSQNIFFLEVYVTFYFMFSFENTINILEKIRKTHINFLINILDFIFISYLILIVIILIPLNIIINFAKDNFNSFLNFIAILPLQYLSEDDKFYKEVLRLEGKLFY